MCLIVQTFKTLIIEPNNNFRKTLRNILSSRFPFMSLEEAASREEALAKLKEPLPDLIFMEIKSPGEKKVFELTNRIKNFYPKISIIVFTQHDTPEYRKAALEKGSDYFLSKDSSSIPEVLSLVESLVSSVDSRRTDEGV